MLRLNQTADGGNGFNELTELIQICENQTLLGQRLLDGVISFASSRQEASGKSRCHFYLNHGVTKHTCYICYTLLNDRIRTFSVDYRG